MLRIDSTVTVTSIHELSDSSLLWDSIPVLVRLLQQMQTLVDDTNLVEDCNHQGLVKKHLSAIVYTRGQDKKARLYRDLVEATQKTLAYAEVASLQLAVVGDPFACDAWQA